MDARAVFAATRLHARRGAHRRPPTAALFAALGLGALAARCAPPPPRNTQVEDTGEALFDATAPLPTSLGPTGPTGPRDGAARPEPRPDPSDEDCNTPFDDDDDGRVNEDCPCAVGHTAECFSRPRALYRGMCRMGTQRCEESQGAAGRWGACERAWLPLETHGDACEITERPDEAARPASQVDLLWFVDTSLSMEDEIAAVNRGIGDFVESLGRARVDYRVVMIAARGTRSLQICVPPPLGDGSCGDTPVLRHVDREVGSTDGLQRIIDTRPAWSSFVRENARKVFVAVTDDDSDLSASTFTRTVQGWPGFERFSFFSIVGYENTRDCPTLARRGSTYLTLSEQTGGARARICDTDWSAIFRGFALAVIDLTPVRMALGDLARADTVQVFRMNPPARETRLYGGWVYDSYRNDVTLQPSIFPPPPAWVEVRYRPRAASP